MKPNKHLALLAGALMGCLTLMAQNQTITPYSRYGYGILSDNATSQQKAMGGVGYAMNSGRQINVMNPASYAAIDSLTFLFDMGFTLNSMHATDGDNTDNKLSGGLDYITASFRITKRVGAALGLLPYSSTGYAFYNEITGGNSSHTGTGNINQLFGGVAVNPFKGFYVGANVYYMFGSITNEVMAANTAGATSVFQRFMQVRDWRVDMGVQYSVDVSPSTSLTLGLTYAPAKKFHGDAYGLYYDSSASAAPDTIYGPGGTANMDGHYSMPATYGGGVSVMWQQRLMIEADFTYQPWKDAKYATIKDFESSEFANRWKVALGAQFQPSPRGNYLGRTQYRLGGYYNRDYLMVLGNNVRELGVTFGLGLPVPQFKTVINVGFAYRHRQATPQPLVKENYFEVTLGINFNEMWFRKSKIY